VGGDLIGETPALRRTPLYAQHVALGARMMPFAGWEMPLQFAGIVEEHHAVRRRAGLFDASHIGRLTVEGPDAAAFLRSLVTYDVTRIAAGDGRYCLICREDGGILDDIFVSRPAQERFLVVTNAATAQRIDEWARAHLPPGSRVMLTDRQAETAMLALQGPEAPSHLGALTSAAQRLAARHCTEVKVEGTLVFVSRTGYTGEDGFELMVPAADGPTLWQRLVGRGVQPCGLGARDTLRLEAAFPLYGNDIDESTNPFEASLGWTVTFDDGADFVGRQALLRIREAGVTRRMACIRALERGVMRAGCPLLHGGQPVGHLTSGGFSPTLGVSIGLGYLPPELTSARTQLEVDVRGKLLRAQVVPRPFYRRGKGGWLPLIDLPRPQR
jgi:aminomethyltransferase